MPQLLHRAPRRPGPRGSSRLVRSLALGTCLGLAGPLNVAPELGFAPEKGSKLVKTWKERTEIDQVAGSGLAGGQELDLSGLEIRVLATRTVVFEDAYVALREPNEVGHTQPARLERTFQELEYASELDSTEDGVTSTARFTCESPLENSTVVFEWNADRESLDVAYAEDSEGPVAALEGLVEDADLRGLLPDSMEPKEGESWEVSKATVMHLLRPSGELLFVPDPDGELDSLEPIYIGFFLSVAESVRDDAESEGGEARYAGEENGLAVIELELEAEFAREAIEDLRRVVDESALPAGGFGEFSALDLELELEATGQLLWDLEAQRAHSLELEGEVRLKLAAEAGTEEGGSLELELEFEGVVETSLTVEVK